MPRVFGWRYCILHARETVDKTRKNYQYRMATLVLFYHVSYYTLLSNTDITQTHGEYHTLKVNLHYSFFSNSLSLTSNNISRKGLYTHSIVSYYAWRISYCTKCSVLYTKTGPNRMEINPDNYIQRDSIFHA